MKLRCPRGCPGDRETKRLRQCPKCGTKRQPKTKKSNPVATDSWLPLAVPVRVPEPLAVPAYEPRRAATPAPERPRR
ncbi:hypothetical protein GCM10010510_44960 [Streptomyces anandii JCM 4720]|nr:hypothetical protein GCM10010510_44960 [Streptomyces anandii JCM 4720]